MPAVHGMVGDDVALSDEHVVPGNREPVGGDGATLRDGRHAHVVVCGEGAVEIMEIQPEGKKRMSAKDFANGLKNTDSDLKFS